MRAPPVSSYVLLIQVSFIGFFFFGCVLPLADLLKW